MELKKLYASTMITLISLALVAASIAIAEPPKDKTAAAAAPEMKLPPGWTMEDMQACMLAGAPGKMHEHLARGVGKWQGKNTMWMAPGAPPMVSDCNSTVTSIMDGHYVRVETVGEMPGMGLYNGQGTYGFDNVSGKFVSTWIDNHSTGIMTGTGQLSPDGKTLTWTFTYNCPLTKKPAIMRQIDTTTSPTTQTIEMYGADPKTGKEYKMVSIELTKK
ncbi:MAG: hypothetical protein JWN40_1429 [Phycisphaerales bacterium]|nr:hypothetical protein [Phycisphaerales bacterium]